MEQGRNATLRGYLSGRLNLPGLDAAGACKHGNLLVGVNL